VKVGFYAAPSVILGLVPRTHGSASSGVDVFAASIGASREVDPRHKAEDDSREEATLRLNLKLSWMAAVYPEQGFAVTRRVDC
jgi:hypothetical protein